MPEATTQPADSQLSPPATLEWGADLGLQIRIGADRVARLSAPALAAPGPDGVQLSGTLPLIELRFAGDTRYGSADRSVRTASGAGLLYQGHEELRDGAWSELRVDLAEPETGLAARLRLRRPDGVAALQAQVTLANAGTRRLVIESVSSFVLGGLAGRAASGGDRLGDFELWYAENDWLAESRWHRRPLRVLLADVNRRAHGQDPRTEFHRASQGTWSTAHHLPMGALTDWSAGRTVAWQVESGAGWRWELGEHEGAAYLALLGPTDRDHHWRQVLDPGDTFTTVPAAIAFGAHAGAGASADAADHSLAAAIGELTAYRRALRRPHPDHTALPVIFNDYMNTLMGDPTTEKLLPLIDAAAEAGAEVFVIDAGWYDDDAHGWWDSVGEWREARSRFPGGFAEVSDRIRARGMTPGLWLEPEVVGVRSPLASALPEAAFFQRGGIRVAENARYHLDLRHPAAVAHLDGVVDRLVADYGIGYFKFDYNVNAGPGTDLGADSPGAGLLGHHRAHLAWLDALLERHPGLILENCGSGGARADYALLARMQLQSTSDQQDPYRYPPIAAAAPASITPEQAASWAYPQPEHTDDEIAFTLCAALLGRIHLSGYLNRMSPGQRALVAEAVSVYKRIRADIPAALPFWPLGLPGWNEPWIALGLRAPATTYLTVWRRGSADLSRTLTIPQLSGQDVNAGILFPAYGDAAVRWDARSGELTVQLPRPHTACLIALGQSSNGVL